MDALLSAHEALESKGNLSKALTDVQALIAQLQSTRDAVSSDPDKAALHIAKLKNPLKQSFDRIEEDLKEVNKGLNQYQKALKDKFKTAALPSAANDVLSSQPGLVNRAIGMNLLREGKFGVASTFVKEVTAEYVAKREAMDVDGGDAPREGGHEAMTSWIKDFADPDAIMSDEEDGEVLDGPTERGRLQARFAEMYHILDALRNQHNLGPAIDWARQHSMELESRGSNLEFELARLKFVELYTTPGTSTNHEDDDLAGPLQALQYARDNFPAFSTRYTLSTASLLGSLAFAPALATSPYTTLFHDQTTYDAVSASFTSEFCGLLGLSSLSPLYLTATAGSIALPILEKVERVMAASRGQWTSVNELPVETPLPPGYMFHSIFVCPVSKEQATDANPPMMMPCGHVIAKESLEAHSKGKGRVKCPYCPGESRPGDSRRVYI